MMSNQSIFERNVIHSFQVYPDCMRDEMEHLFLRFSQRDKYKAEYLAHMWEQIAPFVELIRGLYPDKAIDEVRGFIKERLCMNVFPPNKKDKSNGIN